MKYLPEWKGHLRIDAFGHVHWDGQPLGQIVSRHRDGAKSPGGMTTNTVFVTGDHEFASMTQAIEHLIANQ